MVAVFVGVSVDVAVLVTVAVFVDVTVLVAVAVLVDVAVFVDVAVAVLVAISVAVLVNVGVLVFWMNGMFVLATSGILFRLLPPPISHITNKIALTTPTPPASIAIIGRWVGAGADIGAVGAFISASNFS